MPPRRETLRIIDANLNRIGEGLRVLEEYARLALNDVPMTQRLKNLRHGLVNPGDEFQQQLLQARDSQGDIGAEMEVPGESGRRNAAGTIAANSRRVQESLRVMEEIAKDPEVELESDQYRKARFELYAIEKDLLSAMTRREKAGRIKGLYVIIDTAFLKGRRHADVTMQAIRGGAQVIQLRDKQGNTRDFLKTAIELKKICAENGVFFIVNDSLEVALASGADGLHIGPEDLPIKEARRWLPVDKVLGCSASTIDEARQAVAEGADYLGVGAMFATATKKDAGVVGPARLAEIRQAVDLPLVAIGGINKENMREVLKAGADAVAVISAVLGADDVEKATRQLARIIEGAQRE